MESLKNDVPGNTKKQKKDNKNKKHKKQTVSNNLSNNVKKKVPNKKPLDSSNDSAANVLLSSTVPSAKDIYLQSLQLTGIENIEKENNNVYEKSCVEPVDPLCIETPTSSTIPSTTNVPPNLTIRSENDLYPQRIVINSDYRSATETKNCEVNVENKDNHPSTSSAFYSITSFLENLDGLLPAQVLQEEDCEEFADSRFGNSYEETINESEMRKINGVEKSDNDIPLISSVFSITNLLRQSINRPTEDNYEHIHQVIEPGRTVKAKNCNEDERENKKLNDKISSKENSSEDTDSSSSSSTDREDIEADQQPNFTDKLVSPQPRQSTSYYEESPLIFEIPKCEKISLNKSKNYSPNEESRKKLYELLASWKLEFMYDKFIEEDLDMDALMDMSWDIRKEFLKQFTFGVIIKFEENFKKITKCDEKQRDSQLSTINTQQQLLPYTKPIIDVQLILNKTSSGKEILSLNGEALKPTLQNLLVEKIVDNMLNEKIKMSVILAENISEQIVKIFPKEKKVTYFYKSDRNQPLGKIYQKYYNKNKVLQKVGLAPQRKRTGNINENVLQEKKQKLSSELSIDIKGSLSAIRLDNCTWDSLEYHWQKTSAHRITEILNSKSTADIILKWSHYKKPKGYSLIEIDFKKMYPDINNIENPINEFVNRIYCVYKKLSDKNLQALIDKIGPQSTLTKNGILATNMYLLHYVLQPTSKQVTTINGKKHHKKFSILDAINSFLVVKETPEMVDEFLQTKSNGGMPVAPFIIIIGKVTEPNCILVFFDFILYKFSSFQSALDICYKIFYVFNLSFPKESVLVWTFLAKFLYEMENGQLHPSVINLIENLNSSA